MNKKIIAVAAVGIIAIGVYANFPVRRKGLSCQPILSSRQCSLSNKISLMAFCLLSKKPALIRMTLSPGSQQVTPISWVGQNTSFQQTGKSLITICG